MILEATFSIKIKNISLLLIPFLIVLFSCTSEKKASPEFKTKSFKLTSEKNYNIDSLKTLKCNNLILNNKDSITLNTSIGFKIDLNFKDKNDTTKSVYFQLNANTYDINLITIWLTGDYGCIDEEVQVIFTNNDEKMAVYNCVNQKEICKVNPFLIFNLPLNNISDLSKLYSIAKCDKIRILKNYQSFIDLELNEIDKLEINQKLLCFSEQEGMLY